MNIREYVAEKGFSVEVIEDRGILTDDDNWQHYAYTLKLTGADDESMITPWMQGLGHDSKVIDVAEVVDSLISDVWSYREAGSFEDWAGEYGYDTDSRKAEKSYNEIGAMADDVIRVMGGAEQFEYVATEIERL